MPPRKTTGEKVIKEKSPETLKNEKRYLDGYKECIAKHYITDFEHIHFSKIGDNVTGIFAKFVMEAIKTIQQTEVHNGKPQMEDSFPPTKYLTIDDKEEAKTTKRAVNTGGRARPSKEKIPERLLDDDEETEMNGNHVENNDVEEVEVDAKEETNETKEEAKRLSYTKFDRSTRVYFTFIINRFLTEYYHLPKDCGKMVKTEEDFLTFTLETASKHFPSRLSRSVVTTVYRNSGTDSIPDHKLSNTFRCAFEPFISGKENPKPNLLEFMVKYLTAYFKLLAMHIAHRFWTCGSNMIKGSMIEAAMRDLDIGNENFAKEQEYIKEGKSFNGLTSGIYAQARFHEEVLLPIVVKKPVVRKPRVKSDDTKKTDEPKSDEPKNEESKNEVVVELDGEEAGEPEQEAEPEPEPEPPKKTTRQLKPKTKA